MTSVDHASRKYRRGGSTRGSAQAGDLVPLLANSVRLFRKACQSSGSSSLILVERHPAGRRGGALLRSSAGKGLRRSPSARGRTGTSRETAAPRSDAGRWSTMPQVSGRRRHPVGRHVEGDRRALRLPFEIAGILRGVDELVLLVDQPVVLLDVRIEGARLQLAEFLPVIGTVEFAQFVPRNMLQPGIRHLDVDRVRPFRVERILPGLRRLGRPRRRSGYRRCRPGRSRPRSSSLRACFCIPACRPPSRGET